jgi:hypothetical protein
MPQRPLCIPFHDSEVLRGRVYPTVIGRMLPSLNADPPPTHATQSSPTPHIPCTYYNHLLTPANRSHYCCYLLVHIMLHITQEPPATPRTLCYDYALTHKPPHCFLRMLLLIFIPTHSLLILNNNPWGGPHTLLLAAKYYTLIPK